MLAYKKPVSHVKEIPASLATMHLAGLGGAWLCRLYASLLTHSGGEVAQMGDQWLSLSAGLLTQLAKH